MFVFWFNKIYTLMRANIIGVDRGLYEGEVSLQTIFPVI